MIVAETMSPETLTVRVRGIDVAVPSLRGDRYSLVCQGRWLRVARLFDEELVPDSDFPPWEQALQHVRSGRLGADLFTFARPLNRTLDGLPLVCVEDNLAVLSTESYDAWWSALSQGSRRNVRLAAKRGIVARRVEFDEALVRGIKAIYDETPVRQGRRFWHFERSQERVRTLNATYLDRCVFIGAYLGEQLVGFVKYVQVDRAAVLIQILALEAHRDKRAMHALLRETVEQCHRGGMTVLIYGKFDYGVNRNSPLTEFKRRNGFVELRFPRYYVPVTWRGRIALASGLHRGWQQLVPAGARTALHALRGSILQSLHRGVPRTKGEAEPPRSEGRSNSLGARS